VLHAVFKVADDNGMLLLDLKDLRAMLQFAGDNASELRTKYGNISTASIGAIQRGLLTLESQGGEKFFGEPALDLKDFMRTDRSGRGSAGPGAGTLSGAGSGESAVMRRWECVRIQVEFGSQEARKGTGWAAMPG